MADRRSMVRALGLFLCLLIGLGAARAEEAAGPPPEAKKAFVDGKAAFERGDYESALRLFQRAVLIAPAPSLYYNIGMAYERLNRFEDSAIAFERYLELVEAPTTDDERTFQTNLRARAATNRERAKQPTPTAPQQPLVEPTPSTTTPSPSRYPQYVYVPYSSIAPPAPPPLTHQQKVDAARRHRNNGIAMLVVGAGLMGASAGIIAYIVVAQPIDRKGGLGDGPYGAALWATTVPLVTGFAFFIPGVVTLARWQGRLNEELKRPDEGAGAAKAALDLYAPPPSLRSAGDGTVLFGAPVVRF